MGKSFTMSRTIHNLIIPLLIIMSLTSQAQDAATLTSRATAAYHRGAYAESAKLYTAALEHGVTNPAIVYNAACSFALSNQPELAFQYLERAIDGGYRDLDNMIADRDLTSLHGDTRWTKILDKLGAARDAYRASLGAPELRDELLAMARADQEVRTRISDTGDTDIAAEVTRRDEANTARLKTIVDLYGWPGKSLVGEDGARAAWLLAQHADQDPAFQEHCLELMGKAVGDEVSALDFAYLTDRVRIAQGRKQLYGTQFMFVDGAMVAQPIENEAEVDQRRHGLGLPPIAEYKRQLEALNRRHHSNHRP